MNALDHLAALPAYVPLERWRCCACDTALMTHRDFAVHMFGQHAIAPDAPSAYTLVIVNDCQDHVGKVYRWEIGGVVAEQYLKLRRLRDSLWDVDAMDMEVGL